MRGSAIRQAVQRARPLLLAVALLLCAVPTAQAIHCPVPNPALDALLPRLTAESTSPKPEIHHAVWVLYSDGRIGLFVGNKPISSIDPLGLWQFSIGAGLGVGGIINLGHNSGRWSIMAEVGWADGFKVELNRNDTGPSPMHGSTPRLGVGISGEIKAGRLLRGDVGINEYVEGDTCDKWHIRGSLQGKGGLKVPFTEAKTEFGGAVGTEMSGTGPSKGWSVQEAHFYAEREGLSVGAGAMVFGGAILGVSW
jgi:hypothetical protein